MTIPPSYREKVFAYNYYYIVLEKIKTKESFYNEFY